MELTIDLTAEQINNQIAAEIDKSTIGEEFAFWLAIIFSSFGLFAPRNATVMTTLFLCALSLPAAIFLILEMYAPFQGLIQISSAPLRSALVHLGK